MKLIDKDALVAEIEKFEKALKNACKPNPFGNVEECMTAAELQALDVVKETINSLEVKEVDLDKEIQNYMALHNLHIKDGGRIVFENGDSPNFMCDMRDIAKHFFELGLSASNPITAADKGTAEEIVINLKRVENDYHIDLTKEIG